MRLTRLALQKHGGGSRVLSDCRSPLQNIGTYENKDLIGGVAGTGAYLAGLPSTFASAFGAAVVAICFVASSALKVEAKPAEPKQKKLKEKPTKAVNKEKDAAEEAQALREAEKGPEACDPICALHPEHLPVATKKREKDRARKIAKRVLILIKKFKFQTER